MPFKVKDRVRETTTTTGTGTITLAGAVAGFQSFAAIGNGNETYYAITDDSAWEVGRGTYTSSGTTLSRQEVLASSNGGSLVNFAAGTKDVFCTYPAERAVVAAPPQNLTGTTPSLTTENGPIQLWQLTANSTPTDGLASGESITLFVNAGSGFTITWPSVAWVGGAAPTPVTVGSTIIELFKIGSQLYGAHAGDVTPQAST